MIVCRFRKAATVLHDVLFGGGGNQQDDVATDHIEVRRTVDCEEVDRWWCEPSNVFTGAGQLWLSNDCSVELLLKVLQQVTKFPCNWLSTPHDVGNHNSYCITRDRETLLSLASELRLLCGLLLGDTACHRDSGCI